MRLAGINDMEAANAHLATYLSGHNERFAIAPADAQNAHIPCPLDEVTLARACAMWHRRKLAKDLGMSSNRQRYIVQTGRAAGSSCGGRQDAESSDG
ncbi:MAG: hypothetical protein PHH47_05475 [Gallionella sp.]|nr:hypothetical protein [Gallionella sp.]MDD4945532.1 hypothetical protein [Gallionella sp.]